MGNGSVVAGKHGPTYPCQMAGAKVGPMSDQEPESPRWVWVADLGLCSLKGGVSGRFTAAGLEETEGRGCGGEADGTVM